MTIVFNSARLRELAKQHGDVNDNGEPSGLAIARRTGVDPGLVSRALNGKRRPGTINLARFSKGYGVPVDEFITEKTAA